MRIVSFVGLCLTVDHKAHHPIFEAELGWREFHAHEVLTAFLEHHHLTVTRSYKGLKTAFEARYGSGNPVVTFCSEFDALPEIGHACGHNLIAISGLAAGLAMKTVIERTKIGTVVVLGTPAEEESGGKIDLIRHGAFDGVDFSMMVHPTREDIVFTGGLACLELNIYYRGRNAHAASEPWNGLNALDAVVLACKTLGH
jgi:amidohydrolase